MVSLASPLSLVFSARCARVSAVNTDPVKWSMRSGHIAVLQGVGETAGGQLVSLDLGQVTAAVARDLRPQKVMMINTTGGIRDERNEVRGRGERGGGWGTG